jgi:general secretion pathway protein D
MLNPGRDSPGRTVRFAGEAPDLEMGRSLRRFCWLLGAALLTFGLIDSPGVALAAPGGSPGDQASSHAPVTLVGLVSLPGKSGETRLELDFSASPPNYTMLSSDGDKPAMSLGQTSRGPGATFAAHSSGLLQGVSFEQQGRTLVLHYRVSAPAKLEVATGGPKSLIVTFAAGGADDADAQHAANGGLPREVDRNAGEDGFEVVLLKYADVSEVVGLLTEAQNVKSNDSFNPQEPNFGSNGLGSSGQGGPVAPQQPTVTNDPLGESVDDTISVDRRLNAIILKGSPERIARLKAKIAAIDVPVQSVQLETMFVELDETGAKNVGIDFNNASNQVAVATYSTGSFVSSGFVSPSLASVSLQAAVYAQVQAGHGKIVSKPRIAAQSGQTAKIITGDALPILTSIALSGVNAVSQQVQYVNVGVTLQIAPRVSSDGFVTSHVFCVVSSVTGTSQGYPTISQREAETSATVRDGDTFVIGGLTQDSDITSTIKVPGLGNIPILGAAFAYKSGTKSKTELYIVVTPRIVRRGDVLAPRAGGAQN